MATKKETYPASFDIDYEEKRDRLSSFFRILWSIPIIVLMTILTASGGELVMDESSREVYRNGGEGIVAGLFAATALMILFRQKYPRWWFNFALELNRFGARVGAYFFLLTDRYPSTTEDQSVHLNIDYPDAQKLNRWLPLVKWFLAIPHYVVLLLLLVFALGGTIVAWLAILFTGKYPKDIFDFMVGFSRWANRVNAYAFMLTTDKYPPFSLD